VRREYANPGADRAASTTASGWRAASSHSGRCGGRGRSCELDWLGVGELLGNRRRGSRWSDIVIFTATAEVDDVVVVSVLKNAEEISFAQTLTVAAEEIARRGTNLTRARGCITNSSTHEIESFFAGQSEPAGPDVSVY
jgi:hypothetical protein